MLLKDLIIHGLKTSPISGDVKIRVSLAYMLKLSKYNDKFNEKYFAQIQTLT